MEKYHKIKTVHLRDNKTHKLTNVFRDDTVEYLKDNEWVFTEKIDGTNIRVYWNGFDVSLFGRSDNAQIPNQLVNRLNKLFIGSENEQMFEQKFNEQSVILFGEGYGAKIQNGEAYSSTQEFILFDVKINDIYLDRDSVNNIANYFNILSVPIIDECKTIDEAVEYVKSNPQSYLGDKQMEGVVGTPKMRLLDFQGERIIVKIKCNDYKGVK
jgi:hypothetical protein